MDTKVLIVDDDRTFVKGLRYSLEQDGYITNAIYRGKALIEILKGEDYNLIILNIMLPDVDGLELCLKIRKDSSIPIITISEKDKDIDKILALEYGADDYLAKPFNDLELKARIKAILRRINMNESNLTDQVIEVDDFKINTLGRKLSIKGKQINLTAKEFDLFMLLSSHPGKIYTREDLLKAIWDYEYFGDLRTVDVHIRRLREKIERDASQAQYILTKWGEGYYFRNKRD
ncbi:MAG TPA: response regulator transcription factor [Tissierellales bacterium]|nr:response regulator transcription factor [Tissierellales bacterium]